MNKPCIPKALEEVWAWKDACYREVSHLPFADAVRKRAEVANCTAQRLGFRAVLSRAQHKAAVAEGRTRYGK